MATPDDYSFIGYCSFPYAYQPIAKDYHLLEFERVITLFNIITSFAHISDERTVDKIDNNIIDDYIYYLHLLKKNADKPYKIIRDYNGVKKMIAMKYAPQKGTRRNTSNFKSYDRKLYNSISRARHVISELALCNEWEYFVTLTINKEYYDRYDLETFMAALGKWLSNYSARKTGGVKIDYLLVPDLDKRGAWHLHGFMNGVPPEHLSKFENRKYLKRLTKKGYLKWPAYESKFGFCALGKVQSKAAVAAYISKCIRKPSVIQKVAKLNSKLYYNTQGLKRSTVIYEGYDLMDFGKCDYGNKFVEVTTVK